MAYGGLLALPGPRLGFRRGSGLAAKVLSHVKCRSFRRGFRKGLIGFLVYGGFDKGFRGSRTVSIIRSLDHVEADEKDGS